MGLVTSPLCNTLAFTGYLILGIVLVSLSQSDPNTIALLLAAAVFFTAACCCATATALSAYNCYRFFKQPVDVERTEPLLDPAAAPTEDESTTSVAVTARPA